MKTENLHMKLIEKLSKKKFEYWKEQFIKEILDEIENLYKINEENSLKSGVSEKLRKIVLEMLNDLVNEAKQIIKQKAIKQKAGEKLI